MKHETIDNGTHRSAAYYIASGTARCEHCGEQAKVIALALPGAHELLDAGDGEGSTWVNASRPAFLFDVTAISEPVRRQLLQACSSYRRRPTPESAWLNHCPHCDEEFPDQALHCEPSGAFCFSSATSAALVTLERIEECLEVSAGGYTMDPEYFSACARR